jgi:hypothetical protein
MRIDPPDSIRFAAPERNGGEPGFSRKCVASQIGGL